MRTVFAGATGSCPFADLLIVRIYYYFRAFLAFAAGFHPCLRTCPLTALACAE